LAELFLKYRQDKLEKRVQKEEAIKCQIEVCDKKLFRKQLRHSNKFYNITQTACILGVHRQTMYYWIKKRWIKTRRDYKGYPVFTVLDIENIIKWRNTIKK
jgi:transcriptional regulator with PAS, ATPase and Fis domain